MEVDQIVSGMLKDCMRIFLFFGGMEPIVFWIHPMVCLVGST